MIKYECEPCGYIYDSAVGDPDAGIDPETAFEDIPDDWTCPICGLGKDVFVPVGTTKPSHPRDTLQLRASRIRTMQPEVIRPVLISWSPHIPIVKP